MRTIFENTGKNYRDEFIAIQQSLPQNTSLSRISNEQRQPSYDFAKKIWSEISGNAWFLSGGNIINGYDNNINIYDIPTYYTVDGLHITIDPYYTTTNSNELFYRSERSVSQFIENMKRINQLFIGIKIYTHDNWQEYLIPQTDGYVNHALTCSLILPKDLVIHLQSNINADPMDEYSFDLQGTKPLLYDAQLDVDSKFNQTLLNPSPIAIKVLLDTILLNYIDIGISKSSNSRELLDVTTKDLLDNNAWGYQSTDPQFILHSLVEYPLGQDKVIADDDYFNAVIWKVFGSHSLGSTGEYIATIDIIYGDDTNTYSALNDGLTPLFNKYSQYIFLKISLSKADANVTFEGYSYISPNMIYNSRYISISPIINKTIIDNTGNQWEDLLPVINLNYSLFCDGKCDLPNEEIEYISEADLVREPNLIQVESPNIAGSSYILNEKDLYIGIDANVRVWGVDSPSRNRTLPIEVELQKIYTQAGYINKASQYEVNNIKVINEAIEYGKITANWYGMYEDRVIIPLDFNSGLSAINPDQLFLDSQLINNNGVSMFPFAIEVMGRSVQVYDEQTFAQVEPNISWISAYSDLLQYGMGSNGKMYIRSTNLYTLIPIPNLPPVLIVEAITEAGMDIDITNIYPEEPERFDNWGGTLNNIPIKYLLENGTDGDVIAVFVKLKDIMYNYFKSQGLSAVNMPASPDGWVEVLNPNIGAINSNCISEADFGDSERSRQDLTGMQIYKRTSDGLYYMQTYIPESNEKIYCPIAQNEIEDKVISLPPEDGDLYLIDNIVESYERLLNFSSATPPKITIESASNSGFYAVLDGGTYYVENDNAYAVSTNKTVGFTDVELLVFGGEWNEYTGAFLDADGSESSLLRVVGDKAGLVLYIPKADGLWYRFSEKGLICDNAIVFDDDFINLYGEFNLVEDLYLLGNEWRNINGENVPVYISSMGIAFLKQENMTTNADAGTPLAFCPIDDITRHDEEPEDDPVETDCEICCTKVEKTKIYYISDQPSVGSVNIPIPIKTFQKKCIIPQYEDSVEYDCEKIKSALMALLEDATNIGLNGLADPCDYTIPCNEVDCQYVEAGSIMVYAVDKCNPSASCQPFEVITTGIQCTQPNNGDMIYEELDCEELVELLRNNNLGREYPSVAVTEPTMNGIANTMTAEQYKNFNKLNNYNLSSLKMQAEKFIKDNHLNKSDNIQKYSFADTVYNKQLNNRKRGNMRTLNGETSPNNDIVVQQANAQSTSKDSYICTEINPLKTIAVTAMGAGLITWLITRK